MVQYDEDVKQPLRAGNRSDSDEKTGDLDLEASSLSTSTKTASGEKVTVKDPQRNKRNFMTSWAIALCTLLAIQCYNRSYSHSHPHGHGTRAAIDGYMRALSYHHHRDHGKHGKHRGHPGMTPDKAEELFLSIPSNESALAASRSYTGFAHIAGRAGDFRTANIVKNQWEHLLGLPKTKDTEKIYDAGSKQSRRLMTGAPSHHGPAGGPRVWIDTYYVLLNHPAPLNATSTTLYLKDGQGNLVHQAKLKEDALEEDPTSKHGNADVPPFHGYSKAGTATGKLVYAHFGMVEDFEKLKEAGVDMNGKIAMVRYGGNFRGLKVKAAQDAGAAGVIIYSDPGDDGEATEEHGFAAYPDGPARQPSSLQRGSVQYLSQFPGDPNTPGYPSYKDSKRVEPTNLPGIPSLPLSYEDAIPLLTALNGRGPCFEDWAGGLGYKGVKYCSGESEGDLTMTNDVVEKVLPIWNTYAVIPGHISDEVVVIGNHRDGWVFGAADPNSGTASVHEIVKAYGQMAKKGWKPLRTMVIASWDAEEYGLVGSTEMAEDYAQWIQKNVVAYLNVDVAAAGSGYYVRASPTLADLFVQVSEIAAPPEHPTNQTLKIGSLGSGSDYTAFLQHLGVASSDLGYTRTSKDPVYHYHSIYDSEYWMEKYGDPGFHRHVKLAKSLGLAALRLADSPILPLNTTRYSEELYNYLASLKDTAAAHNVTSLDFDQLSTSVGKMYNATGKLDVEISHVQKELAGLSETACRKKRGKKAAHLMKRIRSINKRKASFERGFISKEGLPKRPWYKHLAVAPGLNLGYGSTTYPGVTEAITIFKDEEMAKNELDRVSKAIRKSAYSLAGGDRKKDKKKKKHKH